MSTTIKQPHERELLGHPVGLFILFLLKCGNVSHTMGCVEF